MKKLALIPFVCGAGASTPGCEYGPVVLKQMGLDAALRADGLNAAWFEDPETVLDAPFGKKAHETLPPLGSEERRDIVLYHCAHMRDNYIKALNADMMPIGIGGDHAMAAASIAALAQAYNAHGRIGVIWVDAHADLNTPDTSPSQAMHGMPLAAMLGMGDPDFVALAGDKPALKPENIFYLGLRDVDPGEWEYMDQLGIHHYTMEQVRARGVAQAFADALQTVSENTDYLFLSIDLDALDPSVAPSVGTPVHDGFTLDEILPILEWIARDYPPAIMEISEYNPMLQMPEQTFKTLRALLDSLLLIRPPQAA